MKTCCCGCSLRQGCIAAAIYTTAFAVLIMGILSYRVHSQPNDPKWAVNLNIVQIVFECLIILASCLLLAGVIKRKPNLAIPWVVLICINVILRIIIIGFVIHSLAVSGQVDFATGLFALALPFAAVALDIYCIVCVCAYRKEVIAEGQ